MIFDISIFDSVGKKKCGQLDLLFWRIAKLGRNVGVKEATLS